MNRHDRKRQLRALPVSALAIIKKTRKDLRQVVLDYLTDGGN